MKKNLKLVLFCIGITIGLSACDKPEEVPPRIKPQLSSYVMPYALPMNAEERAEIEAIRNEYDQNVK